MDALAEGKEGDQVVITITAPDNKPFSTTGYGLTSSFASPTHDPSAWKVYGLPEQEDWILLDERNDVRFTSRAQLQHFTIAQTPLLREMRINFLRAGYPQTSDTIHIGELEIKGLLPAPQPEDQAVQALPKSRGIPPQTLPKEG